MHSLLLLRISIARTIYSVFAYVQGFVFPADDWIQSKERTYITMLAEWFYSNHDIFFRKTPTLKTNSFPQFSYCSEARLGTVSRFWHTIVTSHSFLTLLLSPFLFPLSPFTFPFSPSLPSSLFSLGKQGCPPTSPFFKVISPCMSEDSDVSKGYWFVELSNRLWLWENLLGWCLKGLLTKTFNVGTLWELDPHKYVQVRG